MAIRPHSRAALFVLAVLGLGTGPASAQTPGRAPGDLTTRYRFVERYRPTEERSKLDSIGPYRIGVRETIRTMIENPRGAPDRTEVVFQTKFSERPAQVGGLGEVTDSVRRYEAFRIVPDRAKPGDSRPLEGLTLWYRDRPGFDPELFSLTDDHPLRDVEYRIIARQVEPPALRGLLPALPSRIDDSWRVPKTAARALLGERPLGGDTLTGKLVEVRRTAKGPELEAVINVTGRAALPSTGDTSVNVELVFTFAPAAAPDPAAGKPADEGTVEARGAITKLLMALSATAPLSPQPGERLRRVVARELVLERQLIDATTAPGLALPAAPPKPTEANSWLTYDDPAGRFHFRHPQDLRVPPGPSPPDGAVELEGDRPGAEDAVSIRLQEPTNDVASDRQDRDPEFHRKALRESWQKQKISVVPGAAEWLPDADWAAAKMRVYHVEAVLKPTSRAAKPAARIHFDYYLCPLSGRGESLVLTATTAQDPPTAFRKQAEAILRTVGLGPSNAPRAAGPGHGP